jgi:hypothetical protein
LTIEQNDPDKAASNDVQVNVDIIGENIDPDKEPYPKSDTHQTNK